MKPALDSSKLQKEEVFSIIISELSSTLSSVEYGRWISVLKFISISSGILEIMAPTQFVQEWVIRNYLIKIKRIAIKYDPTVMTVRILSKKEYDTANNQPTNQSVLLDTLESQLDPRMIFQNFVEGDENRLAFRTATLIAKQKSDLGSNIFYIHSKVGLGKTHLLQATTHELKNKRDVKVAYVNAEKFKYQYISSVRSNEILDFRRKIRSLDVLLIDDVQFLCGNKGTQNEFLTTVNYFIDHVKTIILSSDRMPHKLNIDIRSKSRLISSFITEIKSPTYQLRLSIVKKLVSYANILVPEDVQEYIARSVTHTVRELDSCIMKVLTRAKLLNTEVTLALAEEILSETFELYTQTTSVEQILDAVSNEFNVSISEILSKKRNAKISVARQVGALLLKRYTSFSLEEIGRYLGNRKHATIIYYINNILLKEKNDISLSSSISEIVSNLGILSNSST